MLCALDEMCWIIYHYVSLHRLCETDVISDFRHSLEFIRTKVFRNYESRTNRILCYFEICVCLFSIPLFWSFLSSSRMPIYCQVPRNSQRFVVLILVFTLQKVTMLHKHLGLNEPKWAVKFNKVREKLYCSMENYTPNWHIFNF